MYGSSSYKGVVLSFEGNIGSEKSTTMIQFKQQLGIKTGLEPVEEFQKIDGTSTNPLLCFYEAKEDPLPIVLFQNHVKTVLLKNYYRFLNSATNSDPFIIGERLDVRSNFFVFATKLQGYLTDDQWNMFKNSYQINNTPPVHGIVFLNASPTECLARIQKRGRIEEMNIPLSYLEDLENRHTEYKSYLTANNVPC